MRRIRRYAFDEAMLVRLFRLWAKARESGVPALPQMHETAVQLGYPDETAAACLSLFELLEAQLGRSLPSECCNSSNFSGDERTIIGIVRTARPDAIPASANGSTKQLTGAILWAARITQASLYFPSLRPEKLS